MSVSKRLRFEVLRRDNHACRYCGATAPDARLTVDHVLPTALGGSDDPGNLVAACSDCNSGKSATPPDAPLVADVAADAARWALAIGAAALVFEREFTQRDRTRKQFATAWDKWTCDGAVIPRNNDWASSVDRWLAAGLTMTLLLDCITIAMNSKAASDQTWRYFCGVTWRRLTEVQDVARQVAQAQVQHGP